MNTVLIMVVTVAVELVIGFAFAMVMHRIVFARGVDPHVDPDPLRHHHRGLGVRLAVRVQPQQRLGERVVRLAAVDRARTPTGSAATGRRCSRSWSRRSGRPRRSCRCCCSPAWRRSPRTCSRPRKVDGATWWQRLYKVILPNMRAAIMVAVLFRALDAFRIFDNIYVMTRGAQDTESSSFLTYRQVIEQMQLGLGLGALGAAVPLRAAAGVPDRQALQGRPGAGEG